MRIPCFICLNFLILVGEKYVGDFSFSQQCWWRLSSTEMLSRVGWQTFTDFRRIVPPSSAGSNSPRKLLQPTSGKKDFRCRRSRKHRPKFEQILHFDIALYPGVKSLLVKSGHSQLISSLTCDISDFELFLIADFFKINFQDFTAIFVALRVVT